MLALASRPVTAQEATIHGIVLDGTRAPISGARVTATAEDGLSVSAVSDRSGEFTLAPASGRYIINVAAVGFLEASQSVEAGAGVTNTPEFVLEIAGRRETIT